MNISDEVLSEAARYANRVCNMDARDTDIGDARNALESRHGSAWAQYVRKFVEMRDGMLKSNGAWLVEADENGQPSLAFDTYQRSAMALAIYPGRGTGDLSYPMLGLNGEAGEAAEQWKKALRDDGGKLTEERRKAVLKELGDVLWYVTACATEAGFSLREVAEANLAKLNDRAARGKLGGSGDER